jgi:hypothetical protein
MSDSEAPAWGRFLPQSGDEAGVLRFASAHAGRNILVTGAGGYIGSALGWAIAGARPRCIVLLGTVEDTDLLDDAISRFHPELIYHAAAFKHVPLLELRPRDKLTEELTYKTEVSVGFVEGPLEVIETSRLARAELESVMGRLSGCIARRDGSGLIRTLSSVVPEYAMARAARV